MAKPYSVELTDNQLNELSRVSGSIFVTESKLAGQRVSIDYMAEAAKKQRELLSKYDRGEVSTLVVLDNYLSLLAILEDSVSEYSKQLDETDIVLKDARTFIHGIL